MVISQMWGSKGSRTCLWNDWLDKYWNKGKHWWEIGMQPSSSWVIKRLMQCKEIGLQCVSIINNAIRWRGKGDGFVVKDTYNTILEHKEEVDWHKMVWNDFNAPRDSMNAWLVVQNKLMTRDRMSNWGVHCDNTCVLCEAAVESRNHLFFECSFSQEVWKKVMGFLLAVPAGNQWDLLMPWFKGQQQTRMKTKFIAAGTTRIMNGIWKARNYKIFREETISTGFIIQESIWFLKLKLGALKREACSKEDINWMRLMRIIED
ncbi:hypothetical protein QQ045_030717 [Rhodiola kirilowii]